MEHEELRVKLNNLKTIEKTIESLNTYEISGDVRLGDVRSADGETWIQGIYIFDDEIDLIKDFIYSLRIEKCKSLSKDIKNLIKNLYESENDWDQIQENKESINLMDYGKEIIEKLVDDKTFDIKEKSYIEKALLMLDFYDHLLNQNLGLEENTTGLKFNVKKETK